MSVGTIGLLMQEDRVKSIPLTGRVLRVVTLVVRAVDALESTFAYKCRGFLHISGIHV